MIKRFLKVACVLAVVGLLASAALAQSGKCALRVAQVNPAPELFGFKLGMTSAEAKALEPVVELPRTDKLGFSETSFSPDFSAKIDKTKYAGVRTVSLQFLDGKLYSFWIGYTDAFKWNTGADFLPKISGALGLSPDGWHRKGMGQVEDCDGLQAQFQMIARGPSIRLTDLATKDVYDQRRAAAEAAKPDEPDEP
jgi:hypothetical protein